jgi:hypothetical protein
VLSTGFQFGILSRALFKQCAHHCIPGILCANPRMLDWYPECQCKILPHRTESSVCDCYAQDTYRYLSLAHWTQLLSCVPTTCILCANCCSWIICHSACSSIIAKLRWHTGLECAPLRIPKKNPVWSTCCLHENRFY